MKRVNEETLKLYRSMLPHGKMKIIAEQVGVTPMAVSYFLHGRNDSLRIENAVLKTITELKKERDKKMKAAGLS